MNDERDPEEEFPGEEEEETLDLDLDLDIDENDEAEGEEFDGAMEEEEAAEEVGAPPVQEEAASSEESAPESAPPEEEAPIQADVRPDETISVHEVPLHIVVEAGRLKMSLQQLLDLQPGNLLELGVSPESGVNLVVSGKVVGRGELVKVGDALGVRVLEKG